AAGGGALVPPGGEQLQGGPDQRVAGAPLLQLPQARPRHPGDDATDRLHDSSSNGSPRSGYMRGTAGRPHREMVWQLSAADISFCPMTGQTTIDKGAGDGGGPGAPQGAERGTGLRGHPWLTLVTVAVGVMMVALDGTIVAIANPAIAKDLGATWSDLQWITNAYFLALAVSLITAGKLGDRFGHRQPFLVGVAGFAVSSAAIGLSEG